MGLRTVWEPILPGLPSKLKHPVEIGCDLNRRLDKDGSIDDPRSGITDKSCSAATEGDHCTVEKGTGDFKCSFHEV